MNPAPKNPRTPAQLAALAAARERRATAAPRTVPTGYRSIAHLLDCAQEAAGRRAHGTQELAAYLGVTQRPVRAWLRDRAKVPLQPTLDAIALWLQSQAKGG